MANMMRVYKELRWVYAIPNGGKRDRGTAVKLYREGVKAGVLDIHAPFARGGYIGLWIEMKHGRNDTTSEQDAWAEGMHELGHLVVICWGFEPARQALVDYIEGRLIKP
jgi:hypothetical protein